MTSSMAKSGIYYKLAKPDGSPFHDLPEGVDINYRTMQTVKLPEPYYSKKSKLCTDSVIHASKTAIQALGYSKIPCSVFKVRGTPVVEDTDKFGFKELQVLEEIPVTSFDKLFGFKYAEAINPFDPRTIRQKEAPESDALDLLRTWASVRASMWVSVRASVWDSVWASVRASVWDSVWASVRASMWASVWASVRASVWDSVRDSVWDSEAAYIGSLFTKIMKWKYTEKLALKGYPFNSAVELLRKGYIPATDRDKWYLFGFPDGKNVKVLWEEKLQ